MSLQIYLFRPTVNAASEMKLKLADKIGYSKRRNLSNRLRHEMETRSMRKRQGHQKRELQHCTVQYLLESSRTVEVLGWLLFLRFFMFSDICQPGILSLAPEIASRFSWQKSCLFSGGVMWPVYYSPPDPRCMSLLL